MANYFIRAKAYCGKSIAYRLASQLNEEVGKTVGIVCVLKVK